MFRLCLQMFISLYRCVDQYICTLSVVFWDADACTCFFVLTPVLASVTINCSLMRGCNGRSFAPLGLN